ncbi:MAG: fused MFS/spermidine synthase [Candidatus Brocadiia bacterium]
MARQRKSPREAAGARRWPWGETHSLLLVVFVCGGVLMAFEMIGFRILAPTFGTTNFVVGSVISIFLGALSLGYFVGGRLADRVPSFFLLGIIIAVSGLIILVVPLYAPAGCRWISSMNPQGRANPLAAAVALFLVPSVLMGMVSPFAVRLQARTIATVGNVAGKLYALSTLGSIAGTLVATFWLIPSFRLTHIAKGLGVTLLALSLLAILPRLRAQLAARRVRGTASLGATVACGLVLWLVPSASFIPLDEGEILIEEADSPYQHIGVVLIPRERRLGKDHWSLRLKFDKYVESEIVVTVDDREVERALAAGGDGEAHLPAGERGPRYRELLRASLPEGIRIKQPYTSYAKYTDMLHLPFLFRPQAESVLVVGGGGGVVPTLFRRDYPHVAVDVVEIDPVVKDFARRYFGFAPDGDEKLAIHLMDGRVYMRECERRYDIIILDAFTGGRPPFHLLTREFLQLTRSRLLPGGVCHLNIISSLEGPRSRLYHAMLKTFIAVFGRNHVYVFPKWYDPRYGHEDDPAEGVNIELVALNDDDPGARPLTRGELLDTLERIVYPRGHLRMRSRLQTTLVQHLLNYQPRERERDLGHTVVLTDDYAPVDDMVTD